MCILVDSEAGLRLTPRLRKGERAHLLRWYGIWLSICYCGLLLKNLQWVCCRKMVGRSRGFEVVSVVVSADFRHAAQHSGAETPVLSDNSLRSARTK